MGPVEKFHSPKVSHFFLPPRGPAAEKLFLQIFPAVCPGHRLLLAERQRLRDEWKVLEDEGDGFWEDYSIITRLREELKAGEQRREDAQGKLREISAERASLQQDLEEA